LPLRCLGLPEPFLYSILRRLGIEHLEDLCRYTADELRECGVPPTALEGIVAMLRSYGLALAAVRAADATGVDTPALAVTDSFAEPAEPQKSDASDPGIYAPPIAPADQRPFPLADRLHTLLAQVDLRRAEVLRLRYGLEGRPTCKLEEIGRRLGLTRERIRQIEQKAVAKLQHPYRRRLIAPLVAWLEQALCDADGVLSIQAAQATIAAQVGDPTIVSESLIAFVLLFAPALVQITCLPAIALNRLPYGSHIASIPAVCAALKRALHEARTALTGEELLARVATASDTGARGPVVPGSFVAACLRAHPDIAQNEDGTWKLRRKAYSRLGDIIIVLREHGKPLHFTEIAARVNQRLPVDRQARPQSIHAQLGADFQIFARVGPGTFGLAEWGLAPERDSVETAYRILCETGHPLEIDVLIDRVLERWQIQRGSVRIALRLDPRFTRVDPKLIWLAEAPLNR
jgi:DNA-directed RNA polymerase specialized sigma24 family protein